MVAALVLGAGGLLGSEVLASCRSAGFSTPATAGVFDWIHPEGLDDDVAKWAIQALGTDRAQPLVVYWCAGTGYVGSTSSELGQASAALRAALLGLESADLEGVRIHVTYASSAGAVWSGAPEMPVSETSPPATVHAYGEVKLAEENMVRQWADAEGRTATIARISNLFGRNQNPKKNQGLLTKLVASTVGGEPTVLFVPLDTCRDYLPAATAAQMLLADSDEVLANAVDSLSRTRVRIVASERAYTIAQVCGILQRMRRRRVPIAHVVSSATRDQPVRLTFSSSRPSLGIPVPSLEESLSAMFDDESRRRSVNS